MEKRLIKMGLLAIISITGIMLGVFFKESIDTALTRISGFGGEILVLPLVILLLCFGFYIGREYQRSKEDEK